MTNGIDGTTNLQVMDDHNYHGVLLRLGIGNLRKWISSAILALRKHGYRLGNSSFFSVQGLAGGSFAIPAYRDSCTLDNNHLTARGVFHNGIFQYVLTFFDSIICLRYILRGTFGAN
jgi:hypothetical protein